MKHIEMTFESYRDTDKFIKDCYQGDMDITVYEGVLVDNYLGYYPQFDGKTYEYLIIEEVYVNPWLSHQRVTLTDNRELFEQCIEKFERTRDE